MAAAGSQFPGWTGETSTQDGMTAAGKRQFAVMMTAKGAAMTDLGSFRSEIDRIDDQIVDLLARRFAICREVAAFKRRHAIPVVLPDRIEQVKARCTSRAAAQAVDPDFARALYTLIIDQTCRTEQAILEQAE
jgi:chorismate mutase-like protein